MSTDYKINIFVDVHQITLRLSNLFKNRTVKYALECIELRKHNLQKLKNLQKEVIIYLN